MSFIAKLTRTSLRNTSSVRYLGTTPSLFTTAGYGDPQDEKMDNNTPTPASTPDPQPQGQGKGPGSQSGTTDPEVSGAQKSSTTHETKKIGEQPKEEENSPVGG
ncbi:hypothetical protein P7C73_g1565, partial [Tremellales sp. Uapishka_1]